MGNPTGTVKAYLEIKKDCEKAGLDLDINGEKFAFVNVPCSRGAIHFTTLAEVALFVRGYELGLLNAPKQ